MVEPENKSGVLVRLQRFYAGGVLLLVAATPVTAHADEGWTPPPPPGYEAGACVEEELRSDPVASYRISPHCAITNISSIGRYQYGIGQVKDEIRGFETSAVVRRFIEGEFRYNREVRIELHKASEKPATLVCHLDMMRRQVLDASIIRMEFTNDENLKPVEKPLKLENDVLPDLGIFTHAKTVTHLTNRCQ